jgi:GT2 family glycosyltransferase
VADVTGHPRTTVVVLSRNRGDELLQTLGRLSSLPERPPIVVVDNGSRDGSPARVAAEYPGARVISLPGNDGAAARTLGVRAARTELVAFSDDDSWWEPGALGVAAHLFDAHPSIGLIGARVLVGPEQRLEPTCAAMAASPLEPRNGLPGPRVLGFVACGAVVRRRAYVEVGGFHPRFGIGGEEALLAADLAAAGWDLVYVDDLVAHHHPSPSRDRSARRANTVRNDLWSAWLRRPLPVALRRSAELVAGARIDAAGRRGVAAALAGLPWVIAERDVVADGVERDLRRLETAAA